jgi:hypothetical protein
MATDLARPWDGTLDEALVERLILALQRTAVEVGGGQPLPGGQIPIPAPNLSAAHINLLASVLERSPESGTPAGMRKAAQAAGQDLLQLMRGIRRVA